MATATKTKPQRNRHIKVICIEHRYVARTSRKWLDEAGPPLCPSCRREMTEAES